MLFRIASCMNPIVAYLWDRDVEAFEGWNLEGRFKIRNWVKEVLSGWSYFPIRKRARKLWLETPVNLIWAIGKERNRVVFKDVAFPIDRMKHSFVSALISWVGLISDVECSLVRILLCIL